MEHIHIKYKETIEKEVEGKSKKKKGQTISDSKKAFSTIAALLRMHLVSHLDLIWVVTEGRRAYLKRTKSRNKSPSSVQLSLF